MSVTLLSTTNITVNAGTPGSTLTPSSGASHLVAVVSYPDFDGQLTALSVGGVSLTKLCEAHNATNNEANAEIWYLVSPSSSAGQTVSVTLGTWKDVGISFHSISGASTPSAGNTATDAHNAGTNLNASVNCAVGDFVVASASSDRTSGIGTWANSFTSDLSAASPNSFGTWATAHKTAASTTETANIQMANGANTFSAALAVAVFPASAAADVFFGQACL